MGRGCVGAGLTIGWEGLSVGEGCSLLSDGAWEALKGPPLLAAASQPSSCPGPAFSAVA